MIKEYVKKDFVRLVKAGALEGRRWMKATDSSAVRIYDRNLAELPVTVELFGRWAKIVDYADGGLSDEDREAVIDLVNRMVYVERDMIVYQLRRKREGLEQHTLLSQEKTELTVREHGLDFIVDLTSHIDTGLFLDQALVREYVRTISADMRVLNLFSYTGSFSVYAAAGGAACVTSVDMSNTYSDICRRNLEANGFADSQRYNVVVSDCLPFVRAEVERGGRWDVIIFDPPSFSNSHRMERPFDVKKDYMDWLAMLSRIMSDHAILIFSCNSSTFALDKARVKKAFRIVETGQDLAPVGFSRHRGGISRVWVMERLAVFNAPTGRGERVKRVEDQDFERLVSSYDSEETVREDRSARGAGRDERPRYREGGRRESFRREDSRPRYGRDERPRYRDDDRKSSYRRDDDRPRYGRDERPRYRDDDRKPSYRRDDDRPRYGRDERPRYRDDDRKPSCSRDDARPRRREDDRRPFPRRDEERPYHEHGSMGQNDRPRSRAQSHSYDRDRRKKGAVKPYGYDSFTRSRRRDDQDED